MGEGRQQKATPFKMLPGAVLTPRHPSADPQSVDRKGMSGGNRTVTQMRLTSVGQIQSCLFRCAKRTSLLDKSSVDISSTSTCPKPCRSRRDPGEGQKRRVPGPMLRRLCPEEGLVALKGAVGNLNRWVGGLGIFVYKRRTECCPFFSRRFCRHFALTRRTKCCPFFSLSSP